MSGFETFRSMKDKSVNSSADAVVKKSSKPVVPVQDWPADFDVNELPYFLRDDVPDIPPQSWTAPFGWRP